MKINYFIQFFSVRMAKIMGITAPTIHAKPVKQPPNSLFLAIVIISLLRMAGIEVAASEINPGPTTLLVAASVGPLEYLSGSEVILKNARGQVIGRAVTNIRGVALFSLSNETLKELPFNLKTNGGKIISQNYNKVNGPRLKGYLGGEVEYIVPGQTNLSYLDLISTTALRIKNRKTPYKEAVNKVRKAFGIGARAPENVLRYGNNYVEWIRLRNHISRSNGYNSYINTLVERISSGQKITNLKPRHSLHPNSMMKINLAHEVKPTSISNGYDGTTAQISSESNTAYTPCSASVGNSSSNGGASTETILAVGIASTKALMSVAGFKKASGVATAAGMLLAGGASGSSATTEAIEAVQEQLVCISQQLSYLSQQIGELQLTTDVNTASSCTAAVTQQYYLYQSYVEMAEPQADGSPSQYPLDSTNSSFVNTVDDWGPGNGTASLTNCGQSINQSLFGTSGGQGSSWQQLNKNYQNAYKWYSQVQTQELQQFLAWWSMMLYDTFVLTNEYYNYYQQFQAAEIAAGSYEGSTTVCDAGSTSLTPTFCVWQNNISKAYPGDLYSDEAGIPTTGLGVIAFPGATQMPVQFTDPFTSKKKTIWYDLSTKYFLDNFQAEIFKDLNIPAYPYDDIATEYMESKGLNPGGLDSAVEYFSNPQAAHSGANKSQVDVLNQPGPPGPWAPNSASTSARQFFVYQINKSPASPWKKFNDETWGLAFYTRDNVSISNYYDEGLETLRFNSSIGSKTESWLCPAYAEPPTCDYEPIYYFGILQKRNWWAGAKDATSYSPPAPPTPTL